MRLVKRMRALVETSPPRINQLELIEADERRELAIDALLPALPFNHIGPIDSPCLGKLIQQGAAQRPPYSAPPIETRTEAKPQYLLRTQRRGSIRK